MSTEHNVTTYPVRFYTDSSTAQLPNCRLAVINWKATKAKDGTVVPARKSVCVDIPKIALSVTPEILSVALSAALIDLQNEFLRDKIESSYASGKESIFFTHSELEASNLANWCSEKAVSQKLSGEAIATWFTSCLREQLEESFAAIPNVTDEQLEKAISDYSSTFKKLASPAWQPGEKVAKQLQSVLAKAKADKVTDQITKRLETILAPKPESELLSLSF